VSLPHDSSYTHVTGQSEYIDDRPPLTSELFLHILYSPHAHALIQKIDVSEALEAPGVAAVFTAKDFPHNLWGSIFQDQPLLADTEVNYVGESIAIIAADSYLRAVQASRLIKVDYEILPAILSIDEAKEKGSFIGSPRKIERGDVETALSQAPHRLEGKIVLKGADHFYLESQAAIAYPKEDGQIEIHSSSQHPTEIQHVVAHALNLSSKDVTCIVKRMGGAFGGKESQAAPFAAYAALVASRLKRAARLVLTKDDDMVMTGKRNPFENFYRVGFDSEGQLLALDIELFSDGGAFADLSTAIMERAMLHCDNAYYLPYVRVQGRVCRTHIHPHTAFRGFGGPKGVATIERILEEVAHALGKDPLEVRKKNCYRSEGGRNITHYGQVLENNLLPRLFEDLERSSDYRKKRVAIEQHNKEALESNRHETIQGLSLTAVKFGISFTTRFFNQGNALVIIHRDGTLQVSTGATEMGQGVNTRIAQVVAEELGISSDNVRVMATSTEKNGNTSPTAASSGTDLNASAALMAARKIKARLSVLAKALSEKSEERWARHTAAFGSEPEIPVFNNAFDYSLPNDGTDPTRARISFHGIEFKEGKVTCSEKASFKISFSDLVNEAYLNRISLSEYGHYRVPGVTFNKLTGQGHPFLYFTQGVGSSHVSVDLCTGEVKVLGVDLLMDLGRPINEGLDMGQVWGGFIQGMGWALTENLYYSPQGALLSHAPSTYKIPNIQDTPRNFTARLIPNDDNTVNVRGTKAVGEPPLLLGIGTWTAVQNALTYLPSYKDTYPRLSLPATSEVVLRVIAESRFSRYEKKKKTK
jgi:xanthine dehydrogenase large subunit